MNNIGVHANMGGGRGGRGLGRGVDRLRWGITGYVVGRFNTVRSRAYLSHVGLCLAVLLLWPFVPCRSSRFHWSSSATLIACFPPVPSTPPSPHLIMRELHQPPTKAATTVLQYSNYQDASYYCIWYCSAPGMIAQEDHPPLRLWLSHPCLSNPTPASSLIKHTI